MNPVLRVLARFKAPALCLTAMIVVINVLPGARDAEVVEVSGADSGGAVVLGPGDAGATGAGASESAAQAGIGGAQVATGGSAARAGSGPVAGAPKNCDPATGKVRFPSIYSPPCVASVSNNGGATSQGVTGSEILVVLYRAQADPTITTLLRAAGASDEPEEVIASYRDWLDVFQGNYETYGRRVRLVPFQASGPSDDDAAARADAVRVATQYKPFAVIGGPSPFVDALSARGVVMITQLQRPQEYFASRTPYVYGTQMSSTQAFLHLAEYIGKRVAGRNAVHAGDNAFKGKTRTFGLIYLDTPEAVYKPGVDSLERELAKYNVRLTDKVSYEGDINRAQEIARVVVSRMKDKGITSVMFSGDPIAPIFFTQEATNQGYFPEWIIPGGTLVDSNFFGRTYDSRQWSHMFGISQLWVRPPQSQTEAYYQHMWWHNRPPAARAAYEVLYQEVQLLFTALHMAGPNLNPATFQAGLFRFPVSGRGAITQLQRSWGNQRQWPFTDYTGWDSVTEVWWDPNAMGEDEIGNRGRGMLQFVNGGRRYASGEWPSSEPAVFNPANSLTAYPALPPSDAYPKYPPPQK